MKKLLKKMLYQVTYNKFEQPSIVIECSLVVEQHSKLVRTSNDIYIYFTIFYLILEFLFNNLLVCCRNNNLYVSNFVWLLWHIMEIITIDFNNKASYNNLKTKLTYRNNIKINAMIGKSMLYKPYREMLNWWKSIMSEYS